MTGEESFNWFRLFSTPGLGPARIHRIHARAKAGGISVAELFKLNKAEVEKLLSPGGAEIYYMLREVDESELRERYTGLTEQGVEVIHPEHELYPQRLLLLYMDSAPSLLFARGALELLRHPPLAAVVGARDADSGALEAAGDIAKAVVMEGLTVVSGFARGIDTAAHIGALEAGGYTVMVLSCGLEKAQYRGNLADYLDLERCLFLSQFHPDEGWKNSYGIIRNHLIVGLSRAVIVVEAESGSGSIQTGHAALKAGVPLLVFSGNALDRIPEGNTELIAGGGIEFSAVSEIGERLKLIKESDESAVRRRSDKRQNELDINRH